MTEERLVLGLDGVMADDAGTNWERKLMVQCWTVVMCRRRGTQNVSTRELESYLKKEAG